MEQASEQRFPIVGVIHLPPLPGSARGAAAAKFDRLLDHARRDAAAWAEGGASALIVENFGDVPFRTGAAGPETVAAMTLAVAAVIAESGLPVGVNVLRNDVEAAAAIAALAGAQFVRANVYVGAAVTDQGVIEGRANAVQAMIRRLEAPVAVWADVDVKHAAPLASRPLGELAEDAVKRGLASALIVTGPGTGHPTSPDDLRAVRLAMPDAPLYVGSGATPETLPSLLAIADGAIVGTGAKANADPANPVEVKRVRALVAAASGISAR
ncbi:MAG: BtpA/SgcQ family protein [Thermomicrobiales bacterium]|nr:BtpA/SgcQ family protein [Thermomicrobiales bacterium]